MHSPNNNSLENFVERHRADFDVHEPSPDLWAALEAQLDGPAEETRPVRPLFISTVNAAPTAAAAPTRSSWLQRYGIAAGLAALVFAAGASEAWKAKPAARQVADAGTNSVLESSAADAALYLGNETAITAANRAGVVGDSQLTAAVRGMETYYVAQLGRRESELRQLGDTSAVPGRLTDWQQQLVSLDSSYRLLKRELLHHPQPEVLLTAMNRNLQIRLDILDQQLHQTTAQDATSVSNAFVLADSRQPQ